MTPKQMSCTSCDASFDARAFCPECGTPTHLAPEDQRILWEMGQWDAAAQEEPRTISVSKRPAAVSASDATASTGRKKPFSPVPMPLKGGTIQRRTPAAPTTSPRERRRTPAPPPVPPRHLVPVTDGASALAPQPVEVEQVAEPDVEEPTSDAPETTASEQATPETASPATVDEHEATQTSEDVAPPEPVAPEPAREPVVRRPSDRERAVPAADGSPAKPKRQERKQHKLLERMGMLAGEDAAYMLDGTVGFNTASFVLTNYRVAVIPHSARLPIRWIPLEEVGKITCRKGSSVVTIDASVEFLRFGTRRAHKLHDAVDALTEYVKEARSGRGGSRHNAQLVQLWCDRTGEIWDSNIGRLRLWVAHHPKVKVAWVLPFVPAITLAVMHLR